MTRRLYCVNDHCPGQTPRVDQGRVYLVRWSTIQTVHHQCPHCDSVLFARKPLDGGARDLGPLEEAPA